MSYAHFTEKERYVISHLKLAEFRLREIARRLGDITPVSAERSTVIVLHMPMMLSTGTTLLKRLLLNVCIRHAVIASKITNLSLSTSRASFDSIGRRKP
jgi:hypothetical protein